MLSPRLKSLYDISLKLLRWNATARLAKIVSRTRPEDLAAILGLFSARQQAEVFDLIEKVEDCGAVLAELEEGAASDLLSGLADARVLRIVRAVSPDQQADIFRMLPDARAQELLKAMKGEEGAQVEGLLRYDQDTAGGIMVPVFFAQREGTTAGEAIQALQNSSHDVDMPFYLYVLNDYDQLVGVVSLRQLVVRPPDTQLAQMMTTDVFSVRPETDQEEVARVAARYNVLAVPVVDESNRLLGICTVDDLIDVMQEEATEDILRMVGAGDEALDNPGIWRSVRARAPWLGVALVGGAAAAMIIKGYQTSLQAVPLLASFLPLIAGMGGNVGTQSVAIIVRGLATGRIDSGRLMRTVLGEMAVGALLGVGVGFCVFLLGLYMGWAGPVPPVRLGLIIGISMTMAMTLAASVGSMMPLVLARLHLDPAVSTGPFVTSALDVLGLAIYFVIASLLLPPGTLPGL